jgi:hypothetical protein
MAYRREFSDEVKYIMELLETGNVTIALESAKHLLSQAQNNPRLQSACAGILIDGGGVVEDIESVNLGVSLIEELLRKSSTLDEDFITNLNYNLSNGYSSQAKLLCKAGHQESVTDLLQKQKHCLQDVLLKARYLDSEFLPNAISNYANLLGELGRTVEAADYCYDCLNVASDHAVAICNCSSVLQKLLNLSVKHNYKILYEAWKLMKEASQREAELTRLAGQQMVAKCRKSLEAFEAYLISLNPSGAKGLEEWIIGFEKAHNWKPSARLQALRNNRLLLTVNPRPSNCLSEYKDDICFESIVTQLTDEGEKLFQKLVHTFNHIKEDFATARYLYYESQSQANELIEESSITWYLETFDYADFGLRSGFLKTSLRIAADLLDKCAGFLNLYLGLEHPEDEVVLNNVWYLNRNYRKGLHPTISKLLPSNQYLAALRDLNRDLYLGRYPAPIRNLRNEATHKRLVLSLYGSFEESDSSHSLEDFRAITYFLLRMAKAAVIYLVGAVMVEEKRHELECRNNGDENRVVPGMSYEMDYGLSDKLDRLG